MPAIEFTTPITEGAVEAAYAEASRWQYQGRMSKAERALRMAHARDPKFVAALEKGAEIVHKIAERQFGETTRSLSSCFADRTWPTEAQLWREAYRTVDEGRPMQHFAWIYAAAMRLADLEGS